MHASRMAEGKEAYQGKLLEARQVRLERRIYFAFKFGPNRNVGMVSMVR